MIVELQKASKGLTLKMVCQNLADVFKKGLNRGIIKGHTEETCIECGLI